MKKLIFFSLLVGFGFTLRGVVFAAGDAEKAIEQFLRGNSIAQKEGMNTFIEMGDSALPVLKEYFDKAKMSDKVRILPAFQNIKTTASLETLVSLLIKECSKPPSDKIWGYHPFNVEIKNYLMGSIMLMNISNETKMDVVEKNLSIYRNQPEKEIFKRLIIVSGLIGQSKYYETIFGYAKEEPDQSLREMAVYVLGKIGNRQAIPFLEESLKDGFFIMEPEPGPGSDIMPPKGYKFYPIREAAIHALSDMGIKVGRKGAEIWVENQATK